MKRFLRVIDDFYPDPDAIRRKAGSLKYREPEGLTGWRTRAYHPAGIRERIEKSVGVRILEWEDDPHAIETSNGVFFSAFSAGNRAERVGVHYDDPTQWLTLLVYMTPDAPLDTGTSFWRHRETGLARAPTRSDARRLGISVSVLDEILNGDSLKPRCWEEIDRVGNLYNRAVIFRAGMLHSATRHFGSAKADGRIFHSFHFGAR